MPTNQTNFEILAIAIITSQYPSKTIFSVNMNSKFDDKKYKKFWGKNKLKCSDWLGKHSAASVSDKSESKIYFTSRHL